MSGHIDVDFKVLPLGKEPMSKKLQKNKSAAAITRKENKKLDIDNKQMEWRLHQLKVTMEKEKEDRGKQGYFWQSSKTEAMESYSRNVLGKTVKTKNSKNKGKTKSSQAAQNVPTKVTVLKDQPLDLPKRDRPSKKLIKKLIEEDPQINEMELMGPISDGTAPEPPVNNEAWISIATDRLSDDVMEVQSDAKGNLPISSLQAIEPAAIGLYFIKWGRRRILPAVDQHIIRPKQGWGVETYYPYVLNNTQAGQTNRTTVVNPPNFTLPDEFKKQKKKKTEIVHKLPENSLLRGQFDEDESAQSFQQALKEWREKKDTPADNKVGKRADGIVTTPRVEMSVHAVQSDPVSIDIKFSETSSLSYMERLLLKKHRTSDIPPLPIHRSSSVNYIESFETEEFKLTDEELEDRERIRQLFTPRPSSRYSNDIDDNEKHSCIVTEVTDDIGDLTDNEESPFIVEYVSDDQDDDSTPQQNVTYAVDMELESVTTGRVSQTSSSRSVEVATPRLTSYPPPVASSPTSPQVATPTRQSPDGNERQPTSSRKSPTLSYAAHPLNHPKIKMSVTPEPIRSIQSNRTFIKSPTPPASASQKGTTFRNVRSSSASRRGDQRDRDVESASGDRISLVSAVSRLPINPDAHYNNSLADFFTEQVAGDTVLTPTLDAVRIDREIIEASSPEQLLMCNQVASSWVPYNSIAFGNEEDDGVDQSIDASRFVKSQLIDDNENVECFTPTESRLSNVDDERYQQEEDDATTLDNLEWELASKTGNITEDGRISRLIDEWSEDDEDQELGIINDNWAGSGLSTPEIDHLSLDGDGSPQQWRYQDFNDFEQMEHYMINDVTHQDEEYQRRSFSQ